ncbi:MAG: preprotein translocase subunit SecE [Candidatus Caenarcaniphilales bacterium]|nr:preprotein translocase subunit SecE [Candidatus Caenarcaniphilales bacterium]
MSASKQPFFGLFQYLADVAREARYITWPHQKQVLNQFVVVVIVSALLTIMFFGADLGIAEIIKFLKTLV